MSNRAAQLRQLRPPPIQTSMQRPQTAPSTGTPTHLNSNQANGRATRASDNPNGHHDSAGSQPRNQLSPSSPPGQQRFVLTDPIAFRYLEEDPATTVLDRKRELQGYECYIVEQWATSRSHPTFTITTYTGDPASMVLVDVLSVPTNEATWSSRLRVYFKALNQYHARRRETPLGILMVTNLSGFPSSLSVIPVPDGDLRKHRNDFFVNENLKRLNCSGRVGLTLAAPATATVAKFHQVYRTSDKNEAYLAVIELVKLCQSALLLFDKLEIDYADGLLCDVTERAVNDWWLEMGSQYYSIEPHDGILGPTTVAGLLGLLMGARNRLHAISAPVPKDPFDVEGMKKGISAFQKQQRIPRSRRLDRRTLERLHKATQKAANKDGIWNVPKAVKSTVAELSGKGGERVMDVVQRKDRASIAEIETCDIDRFVQLVFGEFAKWLWYGRPLKSKSGKESVDVPMRVGEEKEGLKFRENEHGGFTWTARKSVGDGLVALGVKKERDEAENVASATDQSPSGDEKGKSLLKRTAGFKDAKGGLGRIKGAVGLGNHQRNVSKDVNGHADEPPQTPKGHPRQSFDIPETPASPAISPRGSFDESAYIQRPQRPSLNRAQSNPAVSPEAKKQPQKAHRYGPSLTGSIREPIAAPTYAASYREVRGTQSKESMRPPSYLAPEKLQSDTNELPKQNERSDAGSISPSIAGSIYNDVDLDEVLPTGPETDQDSDRLLRRTVSASQVVTAHIQTRSNDAYPRHLSFSLAEDSVLTWSSVVDQNGSGESYFDDPESQLVEETFIASESQHLNQMLRLLSSETATFTQSQLGTLQSFLNKLDADQRATEELHQPLAHQVEGLRAHSGGLMRAERERLEEAGKELETLAAKLEYEISGLKGKVEDVQAGVGDFEKSVARVEDRVRELEKDERRAEEGWGCVVS